MKDFLKVEAFELIFEEWQGGALPWWLRRVKKLPAL